MKKTNSSPLFITSILFVGMAIGFMSAPFFFKSVSSDIEVRIIKYKAAQELCGIGNVVEVTKYTKEEGDVGIGDYTCASFEEAIKTPEQKEEDEKQFELHEDYSDYRDKVGYDPYNGFRGLSFREWLKINNK